MQEGDRDKLVKVLRMFGSAHDGEVAAAARRAHAIVKQHTLDWDDLLIPVGVRKAEREEPSQPPPPSEAELIQRARQFLSHLTEWETEFLSSVAESLLEWGRLTPKQRAVLDRIVNKLQLHGCW